MKKIRYFVTGSHIYGDTTLDSDLDVVIHPEDKEYIFDKLKELGITWRTSPKFHTSHYINIFGIEINLICVETDFDFKAWQYATGCMRQFSNNYMPGRLALIALFKGYLEDYKFYDD